MTDDLTMPPTFGQVIADLRRRIDALERNQAKGRATDHRVTATFTSFPSPVWRPPAPFSVTNLWADVSTAVGTDTTFSLRRNGSAIGAVTIANGDKVGMASLGPIALDVYDTVDVVRTAGGADATVQAIGTSQHPITPSLSSGGCSPVPGGTLSHVGTTDNIDGTGGELLYTNASSYSVKLLDYLTRGSDSRWVADVDCLLWVAYTVIASASGATTFGGAVNYGDPMAWSSAAASAATPGNALSGQAVIELAAGDEVCVAVTTDGTSPTYQTFDFTVMVVCSPAYQEDPPG